MKPTRPTKTKRQIRRINRTDALVFVGGIDGLALALGRCFPDLPADVQVRALELKHQMAIVRRKFLPL